MTINELLAAAGLTANDVIPIWDAEATSSEEPTKKITAQELAAALKIIGSYLTYSQQTLTPAQQAQVQANLGLEIATMAEVKAYLGLN